MNKTFPDATTWRDCPGLDDLAAFLEGETEAMERKAVLLHLIACRRCYFIFRETLRFLEEDETEQ